MGGGGGREVVLVIEKQPETSLCQCTIQYLDLVLDAGTYTCDKIV